jgi:hypothetical protein
MPVPACLTIWNGWGIRNDDASLFVLKVVCVLSLLGGTYTTNKDMFIFFKSVAAERMRERWLEVFAHERYPDLKKRVEIVKVKMGPQGEELVQKWNDGRPEMTSTHDAFTKRGRTCLTRVWQDLLVGRRGAPIWLLDVPRIANWEAEVEQLLVKHGFGSEPQR